MTTQDVKNTSQAGSGCLLVIALPFAVGGLFVLGLVARDFHTWVRVQSWVATPAVLERAELRAGSTKGKPTHRATATYRYEFAGRVYRSDRVAVHQEGDNIGAYHVDRGRELERLHKARRPITCFVNPADPAQAILYRDLRPGFFLAKTLFGSLFAAVGCGLLYASAWSLKEARRQAAAERRYPGEPWKHREDWRLGRVKTNAGAAAWAMGIFAAIWNVMSWPIFIGILLEGRLEFGPILLVLMFPAIGVILAWWAGYLIVRRIKWGVSELELAAVPGVLGGPLAGVIHTPARVNAQQGFKIRLSCIETVRQRSGGKSTSRDITRWQTEKTIERDLSSSEATHIPVQFLIPYGLPSSGEEDINWKLTAEAATEGVDYHAEFEVPVFGTTASSPVPGDEASSLGPNTVLEGDLPGDWRR